MNKKHIYIIKLQIAYRDGELKKTVSYLEYVLVRVCIKTFN